MNIFIDIETVPGEAIPDVSDVKVPQNYKDPVKIAEYQKANQDEQYRAQALDSMKGRIICVGYAFDNSFPIIITGEEDVIMADLTLGLKSAISYNEPLTFIGWNILTFDIPWLWRKAVQYDVKALRNLIPKTNPRMVVDLMKLWASDFKDNVKMSNCAKFLGIPHSDISGADVYDLWKAGDTASIEKHCSDDIKTCREIYKRLYD